MDDLRIGEVTQVFPEEGKVIVAYEDNDNATVKLPLLTFNGEYLMPEVGDTVLTAHLHSGSSTGFVLGKYYSQDNEVKADLEEGEIFRKDITEETYLSVTEEDLTTLITKRLRMTGDDWELALDNEEGSHIETHDLLIKSTEGTLEIEASNGDIAVYSKEKLDIDCDDDIEAEADKDINVTAGANMAATATGTMQMTSGGNMTLSAGGDISLSGGGKSETFSHLIERIEALEQALQNI